ncbi:MAG: 30S ribosomal protein S6 [Oscillospiraceae bacterium]|mgnify:CR=1 FL=1|nr:30S ribosomal protein S6 [Oscillospiraceae bacterium]
MAKITANYESMVVFSVKAGEEAVNALVAKFKDMIEANATLTNVEEWGKRKLAYEINYETEGYYVIYTFESKPDFPAELNRVLNITEGVLRSIVITK